MVREARNALTLHAPGLRSGPDALTRGGAVTGCSIESMSYVYGGFHDTCLEYEIITA